MHKATIAALLAFSIFSAVAEPDSIRDGFKTPPTGYGEVPFWWWNGERLDKERIKYELDQLAAAGVSGTQINYSHLRSGGWRTAKADPEVFSDEWWDVFAFAAEESARHGMGIGLSGYTLDWPDRDNLFRRLGLRTDRPLEPDSAKNVIEKFFAPFEERVSENARGALNYFFHDELRLPAFSDAGDFAAEFKRRKGYDYNPKDRSPRMLLDANDVYTRLAGERWFEPIYNYHASRGRIWACDPASRGKDPLEFGDYMRAIRWYTAPGFDTPGSFADHVKNKVGSSIAHLYRRDRVWLEGYHSLGWQASTATIFDSTIHNYVYGSSLFNLHGLYYTTYGGWWEWAPPCYHFRQPYWALMPTTFRYFERLSYLLTRGVHVADYAIVNPQSCCAVDRRKAEGSVRLSHRLVEELAVKRSADCDFIDEDSLVAATIATNSSGVVSLCVAGEQYRVLVLPDCFCLRSRPLARIAEFARAGGKVAVVGQLPSLSDGDIALDVATLKEKAFVISEQSIDEIVALAQTRDFSGPRGVKVLHRHTDNEDIYFLVDMPEGENSCTLRALGRAEIWNAWTGQMLSLATATAKEDGTTSLTVPAEKGQPVIVVLTRDESEAPRPAKPAIQGAPGSTIALDGDWRFSLKPTLDNRYGDFRLPATPGFIGAEAREFRWRPQGESSWTTATAGYGVQFMRSVNGGAPQPFSFSWRYGVEGCPAYQDCHHGLNKVVGDAFFILGPYDWNLYDIKVRGKPEDVVYTTFVYAPEKCRAVVETVATAPAETRHPAPVPAQIKVGERVVKPCDEVELEAGGTPFSVRYDGKFGRAFAFLRRLDVPAAPSTTPLSSKWYGDESILRFDPLGGANMEMECRISLPPACREVRGTVNGEIVSASIAGKELGDAAGMKGDFKLSIDEPGDKVAELELVVRRSPGALGGGVFEGPLALECGEGLLAPGDWASTGALKFYSGGAIYSREVTLSAGDLAGRRVRLDLGGIGAAARIRVNGGEPKVLATPPWRVEITGELKPGVNTIEVEVYNTLNNHYQSIPTRYKVPTGKSPSGLLGPVKLELFDK